LLLPNPQSVGLPEIYFGQENRAKQLFEGEECSQGEEEVMGNKLELV
jgi:hypothetical protein